MNIESALSQKQRKQTVLDISHYINGSPERFALLADIFFGSEDKRLVQNAAWAMWYATEHHPELIAPYLSESIAYLTSYPHPAVPRNLLKILDNTDIPEDYLGYLIEACFELIGDPNQAIAIRSNAMKLAQKVARQIPALQEELCATVSMYMEHESAGFQSRAKKILKEFG